MAKVTKVSVTHIGQDYGTITIKEFTPGKLDIEIRDYEVDKRLAIKLRKALKELEPAPNF